MAQHSLEIDFEGQSVPAREGEPVAVALWRAGERLLSRSVKYHRPRGAFCFAGSCGNCLMRIGGRPDRLACVTPCEGGLTVETQNALPSARHDLLRAVDWVFPRGFDPHEMFAGIPVASAAVQQVARQLAGLGTLPDGPSVSQAVAPRSVDLLVIGLGRAGQAAARVAGPRALALDGDPWIEPPPGIECWQGAQVLGLYRDGGSPLVAVRYQGAVQRLRPRRVILCSGSREQNLLFEGNDIPGIIGARAARRLVERHGLLPGRKALVLGDGAEAEPTARVLAAAGAAVSWAGEGSGFSGLECFAAHRPLRATGGRRLRELRLVSAAGERRWRGDLVAVATDRAPAFELGVQAGLAVERDGSRGFALSAGDDGATSAPWLWAAGSCTASPLPSEEQGRRAGEAALRG